MAMLALGPHMPGAPPVTETTQNAPPPTALLLGTVSAETPQGSGTRMRKVWEGFQRG